MQPKPVGGTPTDSPAAIAQAALRRFARLTNLVLASTSVTVLGVGPVADELTAALRRIGAQLIGVHTAVAPEVQLLIIVGPGTTVPPIAPGEQPLLLLGVDDDLDRDWFTALPALPARPGIDGRLGPRELFWVEGS